MPRSPPPILPASVPPSTTVAPVYAFAPVSVSVPAPFLLRPPAPEIVPLNSVDAPLPPAVSDPPVSVTDPAPARLPISCAAAISSVAPLSTVTALTTGMAEPPTTRSVPNATLVSPA